MKEKKIIPEIRRNKIIEFIKINKTISLVELINEFNVSEITIRRDLSLLEKRGLIDKIYGGATKKPEQISEIRYLRQLSKMVNEKRRIAVECSKRIKDNYIILLHGGTTCLEIAKNISTKKNLTIITCFPPIIEHLWKESAHNKRSFDIFCPGGKLNIASNLFTGDHGQVFFDNIVIDLSFIGVIALNPFDGFMTTTKEEANLLKSIVKSSKKIIAPADHSKFSKTAFIKVGLLDDIDEIITDKGLSNEVINEFSKFNLKITKAVT